MSSKSLVSDERRRERCAIALSEIVCELGYRDLSASLVARRAKLSRRTFDDLFDGRDDAFRWACDYACAQLVGPMEEAAKRGNTWEARVEATIAALLAATAAHPTLAELYLVHSVAPLGLDPFGERGVAPTLARMLEEAPAEPHAGPERLAELLANGVVALLRWRLLLARETGALDLPPELSGELAILVLGPHRGGTAAGAGARA